MVRRNDVCAADNISRVDEAKGIRYIFVDEAETRKAFPHPAVVVDGIGIPTDPQELETLPVPRFAVKATVA